MSERRLLVLGAAFLLIALLVLVLGMAVVEQDSASAAWLFYGVWSGSWLGMVLCGLGLLSSSGQDQREAEAVKTGVGVVVVALLLRLLALGLEPTLSDDIYRYVWDGRVVLSGSDPYALTPDDQSLEPLRNELWASMPHKDVETVYPPVAQGLFAFAASFSKPMLVFRVLLLGLDLGACWLLVRTLAMAGIDPRRAVLYAWNPLVVIEGVGMGHLDVAGAAVLIVATYCAVRATVCQEPGHGSIGRGRWIVGAGVAVAVGALIKVVPLILVPLWALTLRSRRLIVAFGATLSAGLLPVLLGVGVPPGLLRYGVSWEFNGALFEPLWRLMEKGDAPARAKHALDWLNGVGIDTQALYPYAYPQFLAKVLLLCVLIVWIALLLHKDRNTPPPTSAWLRANLKVLLAAMICTATLYPWYLLWALPFAAATLSVPALVLSASAGLAYLPRLTGIDYFPAVWLLVWLPPLLAFGLSKVRRSRHEEAQR